jgi:hypothetical protein
MSEITIYQKTGADYANEMAWASSQAHSAQTGAIQFALKLHIQHLRFEHNFKVNDIAKRLGLKRNQVSEYLKQGE